MFNEKSGGWITIYKIFTIVSFFTMILLGLLAGIGDSTATFFDLGIGGDDDGFLDFSIWFVIFFIAAFVQYFTNMLMIQFLRNVQIIREKVENM